MQVITLLFISYTVVCPPVHPSVPSVSRSLGPSIPDSLREEEWAESATEMATQTEKVRCVIIGGAKKQDTEGSG